MSHDSSGEVTRFIKRAANGDAEARNELARIVYSDLKAMAWKFMAQERPDHILQPSALVNEAFLRLQKEGAFERATNRRFFFAAAAEAMRRILVEHALERKTQKRGGGWTRNSLDSLLDSYRKQDIDVVALNDALARLKELNPDHFQIVDLRFFAGCTVQEVAEIMGVSTSKIEKDFRVARAFLYDQLSPDDP